MTEREYRVWGYVAGEVLPPDMEFPADSNNPWFRLTREIPDTLLRCGPVSGLSVAPPPGVTWVGGTSRMATIGSELAFVTSVRAEEPEHAMRQVQDEVLPRFLASISALGESPAYGVVIAAHPVTPPGVTVPWTSDSPTARLFSWQAPPPQRVQAATALKGGAFLWAATHDATAKRAAYDLHIANLYLYSRTDDRADVQSILLTYYFVLERIARQIARLHPLMPPDEAASLPALDRLERSLVSEMPTNDKVEAVRKAATELQALHSRGMKRQVEEAGQAMCVDLATVQEAGEFTHIRHSRLGHVSKLGPRSEELVDWLERAQHCAVTYLAKYLRWVADREIAIPD